MINSETKTPIRTDEKIEEVNRLESSLKNEPTLPSTSTTMTDPTLTEEELTYTPLPLEQCIELIQQFVINNELGPELEKDLIKAISTVHNAFVRCDLRLPLLKAFSYDIIAPNERDQNAFECAFEELLPFALVSTNSLKGKINVRFTPKLNDALDPKPIDEQDTDVSTTSFESAFESSICLQTYADRVKVCNDQLLGICRSGNISNAKSLFASDRNRIDARYQDYEALKICIKRGNIHTLELLASESYLGWSRDLINDEASKLAIQAACDCDLAMVSRCLLFTRANNTLLMRRLITIAASSGNAGILAIVLDMRAISPDYHCDLCYAITSSMTSGNRELIHACLAQYAKVMSANYGIVSTGVNEELNRGILIEAAKTEDPELFEHVLKTIYCYFNTDPRWVHKYASFEAFEPVTKTGAIDKLLEICCNQSNSRLVDAVIAKVGDAMPIDPKQLPWFDAACRNNHDSVVNLFMAEPFADPQEWLAICVDQNFTAAIGRIIEKHKASLMVVGAVSKPVRTAMVRYFEAKASACLKQHSS